VIARITFCTPVPKIDTTASAMMISGKEITISMTRCSHRSVWTPK